MSVTFEDILTEIENDRCENIYYSTRTGWWTHTFKDVEAATVKGMIQTEMRTNKVLNDEAVPKEERERIGNLNELRKNLKQIPLDPDGAPLLQLDPIDFIIQVKANPDRYGKHGITALMSAHHQNCDGFVSSAWSEYNRKIDEMKA